MIHLPTRQIMFISLPVILTLTHHSDIVYDIPSGTLSGLLSGILSVMNSGPGALHTSAGDLEFGSRRPPLQPELAIYTSQSQQAGGKTKQKEGWDEDNKVQEEEKGGGGVAPLLKSRDPHLAGKQTTYIHT